RSSTRRISCAAQSFMQHAYWPFNSCKSVYRPRSGKRTDNPIRADPNPLLEALHNPETKGASTLGKVATARMLAGKVLVAAEHRTLGGATHTTERLSVDSGSILTSADMLCHMIGTTATLSVQKMPHCETGHVIRETIRHSAFHSIQSRSR